MPSFLLQPTETTLGQKIAAIRFAMRWLRIVNNQSSVLLELVSMMVGTGHLNILIAVMNSMRRDAEVNLRILAEIEQELTARQFDK